MLHFYKSNPSFYDTAKDVFTQKLKLKFNVRASNCKEILNIIFLEIFYTYFERLEQIRLYLRRNNVCPKNFLLFAHFFTSLVFKQFK